MSKATNATQERETLEPFKEQIPFVYDRTRRYQGFVSGSGAGKTAAGLARTELNADEWNRGAMGAIIAPTTKMIKNNIIPLMRKFGYLQDWELKGPRSDEPGIHTTSGGRILLLSASDERTIEYLNGLNLAYIWMDEHRDIPSRATEIAVQRLRAGDYRNLYVTTTPRGRNHTYDFFVGDHGTTTQEWGEATIYRANNRLCVVGVPTYANPHTPEDYKESVGEDLPEEIRQQEVEGLFVEVGGGVFQRDMFHWIKPTDMPGDIQTVIGVDPAATADSQKANDRDSDFWGVTVAYNHPRKGELFVADTVQRRGMTLKEGASFVQAVCKETEGNPEVIVESNQSQRWLQQELSDRGVNAVPVNTSRNKEDKIIDLSIPVSNGTVKFLEWDENRFEELHQQMLAWPESNHDDMIDSLSLVVNHAQGGSSIFSTNSKPDLW